MIDAHHHIWRQADLPWLLGPEQPRIFGSYDSIKRDYLIDEFIEDTKGTGIKQSIYVQANWAPNWAADEAAWVQQVADESGWPNGIVAFADFTVEDVRPQLEKLAKYPLVRGVRQQLHWHENPVYRFAPHAEMCRDETVQRNIAHLADFDFSFDLQVFPAQMASAADLLAAVPQVKFILQHAGMQVDTSEGGWALWRAGMMRLAEHENLYVKLSAFGTFAHKNDPAFIAQMVGETVGMFGAERCMYGSNFPIEKLWTNYQALFDAFIAATANLDDAQRDAIFNQTARQVYRL